MARLGILCIPSPIREYSTDNHCIHTKGQERSACTQTYAEADRLHLQSGCGLMQVEHIT